MYIAVSILIFIVYAFAYLLLPIVGVLSWQLPTIAVTCSILHRKELIYFTPVVSIC